jgi:hypothetical protein
MSRQGRGAAGNARAQDQMRAWEKLQQSQREADLKDLLKLPAGRRFLWDLIDRRCNVHGTGYSTSGSEMYYLCGERSVGVTLREELRRLDPSGYGVMRAESLEAELSQRITHESAEAKAKTEMDDEEGA